MRKILIILLLISIVSAGILVADKSQVETSNRQVELIMDYNLLADADQLSLLPKLKESGLQTIAVRGESLQELDNKNELVYYTGKRLSLLDNLVQTNAEFDSNALYISGPFKLLVNLKRALKLKLGADRVELDNNILIIKDYQSDSKILKEPLMMTSFGYQLANKYGLDLIPRVSRQVGSSNLANILAKIPKVSQIIFSGEEVVGYPDKLEQTARVLQEFDITLGLIEPFIAYQQGAHKLAQKIDYQSVRVHSIDRQLLLNLRVEEVIGRYLKAVQERGVRSLYLKPFATREETLEFVAGLSRELKETGYQLGRAKPYQQWKKSFHLRYLILLGAVALISLIVDLVQPNFTLSIFILVNITLVLSTLLVRHFAWQLIALVIAIATPILVISYINFQLDRKKGIVDSLILFIQVSLLSLAGGILISGLLSDTSYLLQIRSFRGVKLAFLLPLLLGGVYYLYQQYNSWEKLKEFLLNLFQRPVLWQEIIVITIVLGVGVIYLSRTGNVSVIGVSSIEQMIRGFLEEILPVRPRFKSFLIGHPLLLLGIDHSLQRKKLSWLVVLGLIGPINLLNTLSHLHTPVLISLVRIVEGLLLGGGIGIGLVVVNRKLSVVSGE
ncbi:hypothetical protein JCM16358_19590 [Halanaerocella petrolearia]